MADQTAVDLANEPDWPGIEAAQQFGPADEARRARSDIEHVDEDEAGSIEAVPDGAREGRITGFIESAGEDRDNVPLAPLAPLARDG